MTMLHRLHSRPVLRLLLLAVLLGAGAAQASELELRVKAAFLYNVAKFVNWPEDAQATDNAIDICVFQHAEFARTAQDELNGKRVGQRPVTTRSISALADARDCEIVFVGEEAKRTEVTSGLAELRSQPVLTVGDPESFIDDGGIMRLKRLDGKLRFEVAMQGVQRSGLQLSSKLLRLADIIPAPGS